MKVVGIDQSKRSTAVVCLDEEGSLYDFILIAPPKVMDREQLIDFQWDGISSFLNRMSEDDHLLIALEGAAFSAGGASSDLLWGIQWYIRTRLFVEFPDFPIGIITPATWRSTIVPIVEQRATKLQHGGKIGLKHAVVGKLSHMEVLQFNDYLAKIKSKILLSKGIDPNGRSNEYKKSIFDLADAWGIAKHRLLLHNKGQGVTEVKKAKPVEKKMSVLKRRFPNA